MKIFTTLSFVVCCFLFLLISSQLVAQSNDELLSIMLKNGLITQNQLDSIKAQKSTAKAEPVKDKSFSIDLDFRPRTELRNGYGQLRDDTLSPALFTSQRARLIVSYKQEGKFAFQMSVQDIRMWGNKDPRSNDGTLQIFEAWAEPFFTPKLSLRMGRQKLAFDNQRLFAENDWRQNSGTHDAFNLLYRSERLSSDFVVAWNTNPTGFNNANGSTQSVTVLERNFDNPFNTALPYKGLFVHYLRFKLNDRWVLSSINNVDLLQSTKLNDDKEKLYARFTDGGRIEYQIGKWYLTTSAYLQSGWLASGKKVTAWYVQPEIRYSTSKTTVRLGAEVLSGDDGRHVVSNKHVDHNFVPLYGVAHRFNGNMDYFTRFPIDLNNAGLINPYLFFLNSVSKRLEIKNDFHLFFSESQYITNQQTEDFEKGTPINKYLGFEHDILLIYRPNHYTKIDLGWSYALPTASMKEILSKAKGYGSYGLFPTWWYISFSFKPNLFNYKF
jgi:hypothetical protein